MKYVKLIFLLIMVFLSNFSQANVLNSKRSKIEQNLIDQKLKMDSGTPIILNSETKKIFVPDGAMYEVVFVCKHQEKEKSEKCYFAKIGVK